MQKAQTSLPVGSIIQRRYLVEDQLSKGKNGAVYLVRDQRDRQNLFVLKEVIFPGKKEQHRFTLDSASLKQLDHPALPRVYDVFDDEIQGRAYTLMHYIEGPNLEVMQQQQPWKCFSLPQIMKIMAPIIDAVAYLHGQYPPIVHGDIKPTNIILSKAAHKMMLVDFGIVKEYNVSTTSIFYPSAHAYKAPEQYNGGASPGSDVYELGATFYTLLTETTPIDALFRLIQLREEEPDPLVAVNQLRPDVPRNIAKAVDRAMSISVDGRFSSVEHFWRALNADPTLQETPAPIVVSPVSLRPPVLPKLTIASPAIEPIPKQSQAPSPKENRTLQPVVPKQAEAKPTTASVPKEPKAPDPKKSDALLPIVSEREVASLAAASVPKQSQAPRSRKRSVPLLLILATLIISISMGAVLWSLGFHHAGFVFPTTVVLHKSAPHSGSRPAVVPTLTPSSTHPTNVIDTYKGTIFDIPTNTTSKMFLTQYQQSQGNISGNFTGLHTNGSFKGTLDTSRDIQFIVTDSARQINLSFEGGAELDGNLSGSYCRLNQKGQCSGDYGLWSVAPASS